MAWQLAAAGVQAAASLLGGRKARKEAQRAYAQQKADIAEQNAYNSPAAIRARAEEAGFNPLLFVGPGVGLQSGIADPIQPVMGQAIANAGMAMAQGLVSHGDALAEQSALRAQNVELRRALETATLRPKVGGIYSASVRVPQTPAGIDASAVGGSPVEIKGSTPEATPGAIPVVEGPIPIPEDFERENAPVTTGYIFMEGIDSSGNRFTIPGFNGEPLETDSLPVIAGSWFWDKWKEGPVGRALSSAGGRTGSAIRRSAFDGALKAHGLRPLVKMPGAPVEPGFDVQQARAYNPWVR